MHQLQVRRFPKLRSQFLNFANLISLPTPKPRTFTLAPLLNPTSKLLLSTAKTLKSLTLLFQEPITLHQACVALPYELPILVNSFAKLESLTIIFPNENDREEIEQPYHGTENQQCVRDLMRTCREAMRLSGMIWSDANHQIFVSQNDRDIFYLGLIHETLFHKQRLLKASSSKDNLIPL